MQQKVQFITTVIHQLAKENDDVENRHLLIEATFFRQITYPAQNAAIDGGIRTEHADRSAVTRDDIHHHSQRGRLARAVRTENAVD